MRRRGQADVRRYAQAAARVALRRAYPKALNRWRRAQGAWRMRRMGAITREFTAWHGLQVSGGPFAGMTYPDQAASFLVPKLLGVYERELHGVIEDAIRAGPEVIVNVGAADGYYAVGLARRCPSARVYAFDADARQRDLCRRVAAENGVEQRMCFEGAVGSERVQAVVQGRALLVVDCEGCEQRLLRLDQVPSLRGAMIIVELHDVLVPGVGEAIASQFANTHDVALVHTRAEPPRYGSALALGLSEYRPWPMRWAVLSPRSEPASAAARPPAGDAGL